MNKSIPPDGINRYRVYYPIKTKIRHRTQNVNAKHLQSQCIVSGRSWGPSPYIFDIYISHCLADHCLGLAQPEYEQWRKLMDKTSTCTEIGRRRKHGSVTPNLLRSQFKRQRTLTVPGPSLYKRGGHPYWPFAIDFFYTKLSTVKYSRWPASHVRDF